MTTKAPERSWLLDPNLLKLVHQCRRLIRSEFGVKLHLTEDDLAARLATYAEQSRSPHLANTWQALKDKVPSLAALEDSAKRNYRGQVIADPEPPQQGEHAEAADGDATKGRKKVIYRGQVIYQ
ncbi:hypothetical protein [Marinobacter caseinilyticus]|uniref:hypothetical protein n=1 Tax=Marinobacter caseinilyticus TaxID=2692195 RepID=UPI00140CF7B0|nr:hypothetical protein [Marinobacter caseinilyticus]